MGGSPNERKANLSQPLALMFVPVMEMQIQLSVRVMTDEISDAARRNRLLRVDDSDRLRKFTKTQGAN